MQKVMPKSLHTVTAIVNVAKYVMAESQFNVASAVLVACEILGLSEMDDSYDLRLMAIHKLTK